MAPGWSTPRLRRLLGDPTPSRAEPTPTRCDFAIVGGGILGLAVARELSQRHPRALICVLEREPGLAAHQSGHSSGVIHAGIYYTPGSLKARLCTRGARELYAYCEARGIPHERTGKLVLATSQRELPLLRELRRRGEANGVSGLRWLEGTEIEAIEPHARGLAAVHSPTTGIIDFATVARAFAEDLRSNEGEIACGCEVLSVERRGRSLLLGLPGGEIEARHAIFCAGAWADRLAVQAGADPDPRIVPFRGGYLQLKPAHRALVRSLIYPTPDPALPFLGVHLTRHLDGTVTIGPTASIVAARDAYALRTLRLEDLRDTLTWPGTWRLLRGHWRAAAGELQRAVSRGALVAAAARMVPELGSADVQQGPAGVRAQALARDGRLIDDFVFAGDERALHVRNAPSPGATASLAIAAHVCDEAERSFSLAH